MAAHPDHQQRVLPHAARRQHLAAQRGIAQPRIEGGHVDAERGDGRTPEAIAHHALLEPCTRNDGAIEPAIDCAQFRPEPPKQSVHLPLTQQAGEPAIGIGRDRIGMQKMRARGIALPRRHDPCCGPRRGGLDHIGLLRVQHGVDVLEVPEQPVVPVRDQRLRGHPDHLAARPHLHPVIVARSDHDDLVAERRTELHLLIDIRPHAAAGERIEFGHIDELHGRASSTGLWTGPMLKKPCRYCSVTCTRVTPSPTFTQALRAGG